MASDFDSRDGATPIADTSHASEESHRRPKLHYVDCIIPESDKRKLPQLSMYLMRDNETVNLSPTSPEDTSPTSACQSPGGISNVTASPTPRTPGKTQQAIVDETSSPSGHILQEGKATKIVFGNEIHQAQETSDFALSTKLDHNASGKIDTTSNIYEGDNPAEIVSRTPLPAKKTQNVNTEERTIATALAMESKVESAGDSSKVLLENEQESNSPKKTPRAQKHVFVDTVTKTSSPKIKTPTGRISRASRAAAIRGSRDCNQSVGTVLIRSLSDGPQINRKTPTERILRSRVSHGSQASTVSDHQVLKQNSQSVRIPGSQDKLSPNKKALAPTSPRRNTPERKSKTLAIHSIKKSSSTSKKTRAGKIHISAAKSPRSKKVSTVEDLLVLNSSVAVEEDECHSVSSDEKMISGEVPGTQPAVMSDTDPSTTIEDACRSYIESAGERKCGKVPFGHSMSADEKIGGEVPGKQPAVMSDTDPSTTIEDACRSYIESAGERKCDKIPFGQIRGLKGAKFIPDKTLLEKCYAYFSKIE